MSLAVGLQFEGGPIFRNVRPLGNLLEEFDSKSIEHVHLNPEEIKYGSWDVVLVFRDKETKDKFSSGELKYKAAWDPNVVAETKNINPLKAAKRAARGG